MFDFALPPTVKGDLLDNFLAMGWFRIGSILHTTNITWLNEIEYPVYWLRYNVSAVRLRRNNTKLISANGCFTTCCRPLELNHETVQLFNKYRKRTKFKLGKSLDSILIDTSNDTFDSRIMEVRLHGHLIAAGIFDVGKKSIENIINIYDHAYKQYSLGKFLILSIYKYCLENGYAYYYPGYYIPGQEILSYKLFLDKQATEVYVPEQNTWVGYHEFENGIPHLSS